MVDKKRLIKTLQQLIALDSQNPPGDEQSIAGFVSSYLKKIGFKVRLHTFKPKRVNVVGVWEGRKREKSLLITPHLDTVPAGTNWKTPPLEARIIGNRIYGLGATDCKGNLACALEAMSALAQKKVRLNYDLVLAATADEESGSALGLIPLLKRKLLKVDAAVVLDADDFEIVITQKGLMHLTLSLRGKKAHGAYPWLGVNAIELAAKIIGDLKSKSQDYIKNKYLRPPSVNVGTIKGGDKVNVVSDWCELELDFRFLPGSTANQIVHSLKTTVNRYTRDYKIKIQGIQPPYYITPNHSLVRSLVLAMQSLKIKPRISGSEGATVITFFKALGIPAVATGFGSEGCAHIADEYAHLDNLYKGAQVLVTFLQQYRFS